MLFDTNQNGMSALTVEQIAQLADNLPEPLCQYRSGEVDFILYRAKLFHTPNWLHSHWPAIVSEARRSYLRYGAVPLLDSYDDKAAVYVCRVNYPLIDSEGKRNNHTEWLSIRFIPADGKPLSTEDLDQYHFRGKSVGEHLFEQAGKNDEFFWKSIMTISRICGFSYNDQSNNNGKREMAVQRLKYAAVAFLLMNYQMFHQESARDLKYITAVFNERLFNKIVAEIEQGTSIRLAAPNIESHFKCSPGEVRLERKVMAYHFPGYFLNIHELARLLTRLYKDGKLTALSFKHYLDNFSENEIEAWESSTHRELLYRLRGLGRLLTTHGPIPGATITGEQLRALVDVEVSDGPRLQFIEAESWRAQLIEIMKALRLAPVN